MPPDRGNTAEKCPIDHTARQRWLDAAAQDGRPLSELNLPATFTTPQLKLLHQHGLTKFSLDTGRWEADASKLVIHRPEAKSSSTLPTDRQISTIPRAVETTHTLNPAERAALPANNEADTGSDESTGNWIYPSQEMFFNAMKRKGHSPSAADMATIVPIHNAVNERAWSEIKTWESRAAPTDATTCGGPKLVSFAGDSKKLTPRARWKMLVGYERPFDRHDWVVLRCDGRRVEYVIDFYGGAKTRSLSFHLDVRPKLNSVEGWRMRGWRLVGLG